MRALPGESVAPCCSIVVSVVFPVCLVNATALWVEGWRGEMGADWGSGSDSWSVTKQLVIFSVVDVKSAFNLFKNSQAGKLFFYL